jgi:ribosomal peptide maturation radical SAM protein 1
MMMNYKEKILSAIGEGDILFIIPPFATTKTPITGPHLLDTIANEKGFRSHILYLNLLLASVMGTQLYESVSYGQPYRMLGERLFARSAFGFPPLGKSPEQCLQPSDSVFGRDCNYSIREFEYKYYQTPEFKMDTFLEIEEICTEFIAEVSEIISSLNFKMIGCSTNWEQTNCCIALFKKFKEFKPDILTLIGGSNCEAEMAKGIASLDPSIDYIFSGECEFAFAEFLNDFSKGQLPEANIIEGQPIKDLDSIPIPNYESYSNQIHNFFNADPPKGIVMGIETSRGCWWGKCFFCGMNGKRMRFRQKSISRIHEEFKEVHSNNPEHRIFLVDKLLPDSFLKELVPALSKIEETPQITCEHRPVLTLKDLFQLKEAKMNVLKFGIESLSTGLLTLMNKGVTSSQIIFLLRNTKSLGLYVDWNLLWGFPGDKASFYEETIDIIPLIHHLTPPTVFRHLSLDRFSPYFRRPDYFKIKNLRPWAAYHSIYPSHCDIEKVSYRFIGDYLCASHEQPQLIKKISEEIIKWRSLHKKSTLSMFALADFYIVYDTRTLGNSNKHILEESQAKEVMTFGKYNETEFQSWAVKEGLGIVLDSNYVPLITASKTLLMEFEHQRKED